jgi:hypothetical protein
LSIQLFFVSEDHILGLTGLLKSDYLVKEFFNPKDVYLYISWVFPFLTTYLIIWVFPKWVLIPAFEEEEKYRVEKMKARIKSDKEIVSEEKGLVEEETKKIEAQEKKIVSKKRVEQVDPKVLWEKEYTDFKNNQNFHSFRQIIEAIYKQNGRILWTLNGIRFEVPEAIIAYLHSRDVIELSRDANNYRTISFTDKGKFFVEKYTAGN